MSRGGRRRLAAAVVGAAGAGAAALAGCQGDGGTAGCQLPQQAVLPADPLTLLPAARLDRVGDKFVLIGTDGSNLRWASLDPATGQLGAARAAPLDGTTVGAWFAVAGTEAAGDTGLVAMALPAANAADVQLRVGASTGDGALVPAPGPPLVTLVGAARPGARPPVVMTSSRLGMAAGLAWVDATAGNVMLAALAGSGQPAAQPLVVDSGSTYECLAFSPGKSPLTLTYYKRASPAANPSFVIAEVGENGAVESTLTLPFETRAPGCTLLAATDAGYVLAWQDTLGSWLGVYQTRINLLLTYPFVGAVSFGGADLQPPLAGLAPLGNDFGVIFARLHSAELWRVDAVGTKRRGALTFPSQQGRLGGISAVPVGGDIYATYADYTALDAGVGVAGQRYFVKASCF